MISNIILSLSLLFSFNLLAQTSTPTEESPVLNPKDSVLQNSETSIDSNPKTNIPSADVAPNVDSNTPAPEVKDTKEKAYIQSEYEPTSYTQQFSILADAALLSMWVPNKFGVTVSWRFAPEWAVESSALRGKIDLDNAGVDDIGNAKENRVDIVVRKYFGSSFSVFAGYSFQKVNAEVSDSIRADNPGLPFYGTEIKTHGLIAGIGNRWIWMSGLTVGLDWISATLPLGSSVANDFRDVDTSQFGSVSDANDVKDAVDKIEETPRLTLLHFRIGYTF